MHVNTENSKKQTRPSEQPKSRRSFESFSWLSEANRTPETALLELAKDVAAGVGMTLELRERADLDEDAAYLNKYHCGVLERFSIASCALLHKAIDEHFTRLNRNSAGGK